MRIFGISAAADIFVHCYGKHQWPPTAVLDSRSKSSHTRSRNNHSHRIVMRSYAPDNSSGTLYIMADQHGVRHLSTLVRDSGAATDFLVSRGKLETILRSLCPGVRLLSARNRLDSVRFPERGDARIAVVVQDLGFGDCLALLSALKEIDTRIRGRGLTPRISIFTNFCSPVIDVYRLCSSIAYVHLLPQPIVAFANYNAVIDVSRVRFSSERCLVDSMLDAATINPIDVPLERKRVVIDRLPKASSQLQLSVAKARQKYRRLVLVSPIGSGPTRCMPLSAMGRLATALKRKKDWLVITAHPGLVSQGFYLDWSYLSSRFSDFISMISMCDAVITVDTSAYYVADALNKPAVVMFTTRPAPIWSAPYPKVLPIQVGEIGPLRTSPSSSDPHLVRYAEGLWNCVNFGRVIDRLEHSLQAEDKIKGDHSGRTSSN